MLTDVSPAAAMAPALAGPSPPEPPVELPPAVADLSPAACAAKLAELFPAVFTPGAAKPLKLRIQADIQQRAPDTFSKKTLSIFLHRHTTSTAYLKALANLPARVDLDGQPAGEVADEHREAAAAEVQRRRAIVDERRAAERTAQRAAERNAERTEREAHREAQRKAQHEAQQAARQAHEANEAEGQARAERAALLRAWEATTLTRANFCALKRVPEAELDAALAQARQDRERQQQALRSQPRLPLPPKAMP